MMTFKMSPTDKKEPALPESREMTLWEGGQLVGRPQMVASFRVPEGEEGGGRGLEAWRASSEKAEAWCAVNEANAGPEPDPPSRSSLFSPRPLPTGWQTCAGAARQRESPEWRRLGPGLK